MGQRECSGYFQGWFLGDEKANYLNTEYVVYLHCEERSVSSDKGQKEDLHKKLSNPRNLV